MTLELRFPIKMAKFANKKNHISFGKANPMQKVSFVTGNLLNKRPLPQKRIGMFTQYFKLVPNSYPTEKLNHKYSWATVGSAIRVIYQILMLSDD